MNSKYILASAAVASVLAFTSPANAGLLGGGASGALGGTLSGGLGGIGGIGGLTSTATSSARDVNGIGRATTQHVHDTVNSTADATDRAAANVDKQLESTKAAADSTANVASSAASSVGTDVAKPKLTEAKTAAPKDSAPVKPVKTEAPGLPSVNVAAGGSTSANGNASVQH